MPTYHPIPCVLQDHGGVIVNITATLSFRGQVLQVHAGTAKAAVGMDASSGLPCLDHPWKLSVSM
jgi:hypothetical protein